MHAILNDSLHPTNNVGAVITDHESSTFPLVLLQFVNRIDVDTELFTINRMQTLAQRLVPKLGLGTRSLVGYRPEIIPVTSVVLNRHPVHTQLILVDPQSLLQRWCLTPNDLLFF